MFSYYDIEKDKMIFTKPAWGLRDSIQKVPGAVSIKDFDFKTQKEYFIFGFNRQKDVERFEYLWQTPQLLEGLAEVIDFKKQEYLSKWPHQIN